MLWVKISADDILIYFSEKNGIWHRQVAHPAGLVCGCKEFYPAPKHGKGSYKMCVKVYLYRFSIEYRWFSTLVLHKQ